MLYIIKTKDRGVESHEIGDLTHWYVKPLARGGFSVWLSADKHDAYHNRPLDRGEQAEIAKAIGAAPPVTFHCARDDNE